MCPALAIWRTWVPMMRQPLTRRTPHVRHRFPDELLKDSMSVVKALRQELKSSVKLYLMADTTYGSCCIDEVGAAHVNAECVASLWPHVPQPLQSAHQFVRELCSITGWKVLYGLEYAYAIPEIKILSASSGSSVLGSTSMFEHFYADVSCSVINPSETCSPAIQLGSIDSQVVNESIAEETSQNYNIGGLSWRLPQGRKMEDYLLFWIGSEDPAFANVVLTFNSCEIEELCRYYLFEKAKDANMIGILVGTLGAAGYLHMIHKMRELITKAGKKSYTFVMGRPNPAKLANFPECDVFVNVSCAQTALLDSKEFLAPIITPFEAMLALDRLNLCFCGLLSWLWSETQVQVNQQLDSCKGHLRFWGRQWTGAYVMEFRDLIASTPLAREQSDEARFSFIQGGYVEDLDLLETDEVEEDEILALVNTTEKALQLRDDDTHSLRKSVAKTGAEFFASRSYHGLDISGTNSIPGEFLTGRSGKASGYKDEKTE
ncbi:hypothetical protein DH2020_023655 [Rehmannia glutinosa]|uniref:2-(3-amino-3-carboxypropyl)histidine synthase subunit 2 n=1 Tax=Rehmannia glutinosa TaxID=99300 RepID=A0ABR0WAK7_REHGL